MTTDNTLMAAVSLAVIDADSEHRKLLDSVVLVARVIFEAAASSIFLLDTATGELVFEAVAGQGQDFLVGSRFPASKGIAGWVLDSCQPLIIDDLATDSRFAKGFAESTRYVPKKLMATPVMCDEDAIGVLEVLDATRSGSSPLAQLELLSLFGMQAAAALRIVQRSRAAHSLLNGAAGEIGEIMEVVRVLGSLDDERRTASLRLFGSMRTLLTDT
jgi:GAF domain-containing protein